MYDITTIRLTTDTDISLLVSIRRDGTMLVTDLSNPTVTATITFNESDSTGCIGSALARSVARSVIVARNLTCIEHEDEYDNELLVESVREGIAAILVGENCVPHSLVRVGRELSGCIISEMTMADDESEDAHRAMIHANDRND